MSGREVGRLRLSDRIKVFGGPSASLIRASIVRDKHPFYNPRNYHGDNEAYLELLLRHDFGFVHQVLSYSRKGEGSRTTAYLDRVHSHFAAEVDELTKFGPAYLKAPECEARLRGAWRSYYRFLACSMFRFRGREFWHYHRTVVKAMGYRLNYLRLALHAGGRLLEIALNPLSTARSLLRLLERIRLGILQPAAVTPASPVRASVSRSAAEGF
jgi:hypothetical protein